MQNKYRIDKTEYNELHKNKINDLYQIIHPYKRIYALHEHPEKDNIKDILIELEQINETFKDSRLGFRLFLILLHFNYLEKDIFSFTDTTDFFCLYRFYFYKFKEYWKCYAYFFRCIEIKRDGGDLNFNFLKVLNILDLEINEEYFFDLNFLHKKLSKTSQKDLLIISLKITNFLCKYDFKEKNEIINFIRNSPEYKNKEDLFLEDNLLEDLKKLEDESLKFYDIDNHYGYNALDFCKKNNNLNENITKLSDEMKTLTIIYKNLELFEIKKLGQGGCGKVYLVLFDPKLNNNFDILKNNKKIFNDTFIKFIEKNGNKKIRFALKIVHCDKGDEMYQTVENEIKTLEKLSEYNEIIKMYDYELKNRQISILMEVGSYDLHKYILNRINKIRNVDADDIVINLNKNIFEDTKITMHQEIISDKHLKNKENYNTKKIKHSSCNGRACNFYFPFTEKCKFIDYVGIFSPEEIKEIWMQILNILRILHNKLTIHRDVKHKNFIFVNDKLKIIDFGLSRSITEEWTKHITVHKAGTAMFMSPESKNSKCLSRKSDIWSAGIILRDLVFGYSYIANTFDTTNKKKKFSFCEDSCECHKNLKNIEILAKLYKPKFCEKHANKIGLIRYIDFVFIIGWCLEEDVDKRISLEELFMRKYKFLKKFLY